MASTLHTPTAAPTAESVATSKGQFTARANGRPSSASRSLEDVRLSALAGDILLVCANSVMVFYLRFADQGHILSGVPVPHYVGLLGLYAALVVLFCQNQGLYHHWRSTGPLDESFDVLKAVLLSTLLLTAFIYLSGDKSISRLIIGFSGVLNAITLPAWRFWKREIVKRQVSNGEAERRILIVGAGEAGRALEKHFEENKHLGYAVKGFLEKDGTGRPGVIGNIDDLSRLALTSFADEIFITAPSERDVVNRVVVQARQHHLSVKIVPEIFDGIGWYAPIRYVGSVPVMELLREPISTLGLLLKRVVDVLGAVIGLVVMAPFLIALAVVIHLDSPGPTLYSSWRIGKKGRKFRCYKLRTMVANADQLKDNLRQRNERDGPCFKIANDPRVTRIGHWIRKYSLDEIPQLWNVLLADMSLVGPRPHPLDDFERYALDHLRRLDVKPGITGLWQVYARRDPSFERNMNLDLEYIESWSLWLDFKILLKTFPAVFSGAGA